MPRDEACGTCRFFVPDAAAPEHSDHGRRGECRRFPPVKGATPLPSVFEDRDWCGEFQAVKEV